MKRSLIHILFAAAVLAGCSALNPYRSEFTCPQMENGKCVGVDAAYDESLKKNAATSSTRVDVGVLEKTAGASPSKTYLMYREEVNRKLAALLRKSITPLVAPAQVIRVLILPYRGEGGELFMSRYVYLFADEPRWIMADYLKETVEE